jgi:hypothetical protein
MWNRLKSWLTDAAMLIAAILALAIIGLFVLFSIFGHGKPFGG